MCTQTYIYIYICVRVWAKPPPPRYYGYGEGPLPSPMGWGPRFDGPPLPDGSASQGVPGTRSQAYLSSPRHRSASVYDEEILSQNSGREARIWIPNFWPHILRF